MIAQVALFCLFSLATARPQYGVPDYSSPAYAPIYEAKPEPYSFGFDTKDEYGSTLNRQETGDELGNKRGSYGYTDGYGIYRQVDYVADEHGFRATVKTNEPGTENQNPADVEILSDAIPDHYDAPAAYGKAPVSPAYLKPAAAVYSRPAPVYAPAPASYASSPVYSSAPASYASAPIYNSAPASYASAPAYDAEPAVYSAAPVYEQVAAPVYGGPSYQQLADRASQSESSSAPEHAQYQPAESYSSY